MRGDSSDTDGGDEEYRGASPLADAPSEDAGPGATSGEGSRSDRLRRRLGLTPRQWMVLVSVVLFLPYPAFVYVWFTTSVDETLFLAVTVAYSLFAIVANVVL